MYLTVKQQLKHLSKEEYLSLRELSHTAKNLYNQAVYNIRQYYFQKKKYLNYQKNKYDRQFFFNLSINIFIKSTFQI